MLDFWAVKIALAQINPTVGAIHANARLMVEYARRAEQAGADLVIFPELAICGYPPCDLVEKSDFIEASYEELLEVSRQAAGITMLSGCLIPARAETGKRVHNSALGLRDGKVLFQQSKMLLPTYDVFDELRNFAPARHQSVWAYNGMRLAVTICEDAWNDKKFWPKKNQRLLYETDPVAEQMATGADVLINISASPFAAEKIGLRQDMLSAIAREYQVPVLFVNQVGGNDQLVFDGSSMALGANGELRARAASFEQELLLVEAPEWRGSKRPAPESDIAAIYEALQLGTRDYVRKCGFERVLVGLSGGIDSALTACIAVDALGAEKVMGVGMPSRFSSRGSIEDARKLAANLGIQFELLPIEAPFAAVLGTLQGVWEKLPTTAALADLAQQNLQSRLRGLLLMALSNRSGALVLSTGNKSELAVGYCTLYGDMAGGLAVISDVLKTQVFALAEYVNRERERIPRATITKPPSAELRPDQTDQDDLPPYAVLDTVIRDYVEQYRTAGEIAERHGLEARLVESLIRRIDNSEYKRQQAAPGLKVSPKAFGMGRRFPIAQQYRGWNRMERGVLQPPPPVPHSEPGVAPEEAKPQSGR